MRVVVAIDSFKGSLTTFQASGAVSDGKPVSFGVKGLRDIVKIRLENANHLLSECKFTVACDVKNVLCGNEGCSVVYGPQKGATTEMISDMDTWLENYAKLTKSVCFDSDKNAQGSGAAGGMGFALMSYFGAELKSGIDIVMEETKFGDFIRFEVNLCTVHPEI